MICLGFHLMARTFSRLIVKLVAWTFGILFRPRFRPNFETISQANALTLSFMEVISNKLKFLSTISSSFNQIQSRMTQLITNVDHLEIYGENPLIKVLQENGDLTKEDIQNISIDLQRRKTELDGDKTKDCQVCCMIFDVLLGVIVFMVMNRFTSAAKTAEFVTAWRDETRGYLNELLDWLMGAPAGLKLNQELTLFLGNFFKYHIDIWIGYLALIEAYLPFIIQAIMWSSCLGLSVMLSVSMDALNILTFHTFCFYVYASKIYNLQLRGLIALSRLFRGVKWNPLRNRIDSLSYNADQLALGTILFTVLLFLLPTSGIYYFVFASLRLPILVSQALMYCCIKVLNTLPVHSITKKITFPEKFIEAITFRIAPAESYNSNKKERQTFFRGLKIPCIDTGNGTGLIFNYHLISTASLLKRHIIVGIPSLTGVVALIKMFLTGEIICSLEH